jgi:hypothetical protein
MGVSADVSAVFQDHDRKCPKRTTGQRETIMKTPVNYVTLGLVAAATGAAIVLAPIASAATHPVRAATATTTSAIGNAGTDPLVPYGTEPQVPARLGFVDSNHDEADTTNGQVDLPF